MLERFYNWQADSFYIDNSAAQAAFIGATGATDLASALLDAYVHLESWNVNAVSSHGLEERPHIATFSDPASRLEVNHLLLPETFE